VSGSLATTLWLPASIGGVAECHHLAVLLLFSLYCCFALGALPQPGSVEQAGMWRSWSEHTAATLPPCFKSACLSRLGLRFAAMFQPQPLDR